MYIHGQTTLFPHLEFHLIKIVICTVLVVHFFSNENSILLTKTSPSLKLAKVIIAEQLQVAPYSDGCPPGTARDHFSGKCYQKVYDPGALCGYSPRLSNNLYRWDPQTRSCISTGMSLHDPFFRFFVAGAWGAFSSWWTSRREETVLTYDLEAFNGPATFTPDINDDGMPVGAGFFKPHDVNVSSPSRLMHFATDAPYLVERELRNFINRYPGMLPDGGNDYFVRPAPGGAPMIGAYITAILTQLAERGLTKFCLFMQVPGYSAPDYLMEYIDEFNTFMRKVSNHSISTFWSSNPLHGRLDGTEALVLKAWSTLSGLPKPTCTGSDGVIYRLSSESQTSPWVEFIVSPNNPDGRFLDCMVPSSRCVFDAAYNYIMYYRRAGLSSVLTFPQGSDRRPAEHAFYSFTKYIGTASARWGFAASRDADVWTRLAKLHQPWRTVSYVSSVASWLIMVSTLNTVALGPTSALEQDVSSKMLKYDLLMETYVPDTCPCLEIVNRDVLTGGVSGGYYWIMLKDACATLPVKEGFAPNLYVHLGEYMKMASHVTIYSRDSLFRINGKLYDAGASANQSSVWHPWSRSSFQSRQSLGSEPWDRGSSAGAMGSWARFTRLHFMNSDDEYVKMYLKRVGFICNVNAPRGFLGPLELAKLNPTIIVDENINPGFAGADNSVLYK